MRDSCFFFQNRGCRYFPCHQWPGDLADFNCMGCYCPLYARKDCGGCPAWVRSKTGRLIKDCSHCLRPHENFQEVVASLPT